MERNNIHTWEQQENESYWDHIARENMTETEGLYGFNEYEITKKSGLSNKQIVSLKEYLLDKYGVLSSIKL